ncbi:cupin domain-containing protein [Streptomyces cadmiisoli]|uniref:cupin domain-containing protein n=1 Tax=Streptomyces cadmiisoli TaxID=2184053 RepID=UPI003646E791
MITRRSLMRSSSAATVGSLGLIALGSSSAEAHRNSSEAPAVTPVSADGITRTELQRHLSPAPGWELVQTLVQIPRGVESGRHSHPGVEVGYIIQGDILMEFDDRPWQRLRTGAPFFIPHGVIHNARNIGKVQTKMLSTYQIEHGKPLVTPHQ